MLSTSPSAPALLQLSPKPNTPSPLLSPSPNPAPDPLPLLPLDLLLPLDRPLFPNSFPDKLQSVSSQVRSPSPNEARLVVQELTTLNFPNVSSSESRVEGLFLLYLFVMGSSSSSSSLSLRSVSVSVVMTSLVLASFNFACCCFPSTDPSSRTHFRTSSSLFPHKLDPPPLTRPDSWCRS